MNTTLSRRQFGGRSFLVLTMAIQHRVVLLSTQSPAVWVLESSVRLRPIAGAMTSPNGAWIATVAPFEPLPTCEGEVSMLIEMDESAKVGPLELNVRFLEDTKDGLEWRDYQVVRQGVSTSCETRLLSRAPFKPHFEGTPRWAGLCEDLRRVALKTREIGTPSSVAQEPRLVVPTHRACGPSHLMNKIESSVQEGVGLLVVLGSESDFEWFDTTFDSPRPPSAKPIHVIGFCPSADAGALACFGVRGAPVAVPITSKGYVVHERATFVRELVSIPNRDAAARVAAIVNGL